jgi:hypothetical protein
MPYYLGDAKMQHIVNVDITDSGAGVAGAASIGSQIREITSVSRSALAQKLAKLMVVSAGDIDVGKSISTYGVDSLTAVEVRAWSFRELQRDISIFDIMSNIPIASLARTMVKKSKIVANDIVTADN